VILHLLIILFILLRINVQKIQIVYIISALIIIVLLVIRHPYNIITSCLIIQYIRCDKALYIQYENDKESSTKSCRKKFM